MPQCKQCECCPCYTCYRRYLKETGADMTFDEFKIFLEECPECYATKQ